MKNISSILNGIINGRDSNLLGQSTVCGNAHTCERSNIQGIQFPLENLYSIQPETCAVIALVFPPSAREKSKNNILFRVEPESFHMERRLERKPG